MCMCVSKEVDPEQDKENKRINNLLKFEKKRFDREIKLLLLGAGESGKSTIAKQIRLINQEDFTPDERQNYKTIIHNNAFICMKTILIGGEELGISVKSKELRSLSESIIGESYEWDGNLTENIANDMDSLWKDSGVKEMYGKRSEYQLPDCAEYYLNDVMRLSEEGYTPTNDDIIRSRVKTTGVIETKFDISGATFNLVDVGGQRSERRKWVICFEDVTAVIFCVALSEYNLKCYEDNTTNRMIESIKLFSEIVNSKFFSDVPIIFFLNKSDLLQEKVDEGVSLKIAFSEYDGEHGFQPYVEYIFLRFTEVINNRQKVVYRHITNATSTDNISAVWTAVQDIVLQRALETSFTV